MRSGWAVAFNRVMGWACWESDRQHQGYKNVILPRLLKKAGGVVIIGKWQGAESGEDFTLAGDDVWCSGRYAASAWESFAFFFARLFLVYPTCFSKCTAHLDLSSAAGRVQSAQIPNALTRSFFSWRRLRLYSFRSGVWFYSRCCFSLFCSVQANGCRPADLFSPSGDSDIPLSYRGMADSAFCLALAVVCGTRRKDLLLRPCAFVPVP